MNTKEHRRTWHFNIMLILLTVAGLVAALFVIGQMAQASPKPVHGWTGHHGDRDVIAAICDGSHDGRIDQVGVYLGATLGLDAAQVEDWSRVEQEFEQGMALLQNACGNLASHAAPPTMPARLAFMESAMAAGTEALRVARPAFEAFYGTLDESQRRKVDIFSGRYRDEDR